MKIITKITLSIFYIALINVVGVLGSPAKDIAYGQIDSLPFEIGDIIPPNETTDYNNSNSSIVDENDNCDMPPCPPGQACIQSCP